MRAKRIEIPSDVKLLRKVSRQIEDSLKELNVNESLIFDVRLCVEEAVRNAIVHGNKSDNKLPVFILYTIETGKEKGKITIEVEDNGAGFNEEEVPDPTAEENLYKEGGRGVFLIHKFMDEVAYNEKGNRLVMVKYLPR